MQRPTVPGWRESLAEFDPHAARLPVTAHAAQLLAARGLHDAAIIAYRELLSRDPGHVGHTKEFAALLRRTGRLDEAAAQMRLLHDAELAALGIPDGSRSAPAEFLGAADGIATPPPVAPSHYVTHLFDRYADSFEEHLVDNLGYRGPEVVARTLRSTLGGDSTELAILDAGCGTGLLGGLLRPLARLLDGIDLSPRMIEWARAKNVYDRLQVAELVAALERSEDRYDVVAAVDVFIYFGELGPLLAACRRVLRPGGLLVFTTEAGGERGYRLADTRRYVHNADDVTRKVDAAGLETISLDETVLRSNRRAPVRFHVRATRVV